MSEQKTINCEEALRQLFDYIDNELHAIKHEEMKQHLTTCRSCNSRLEFEKRLHQHVKKATQQEVPDNLQKKIKKLIQKL